MQTGTHKTFSSSIKMLHQEQFTRVAPLISAALLLGSGGGFVLAAVLTLSNMLHVPLGPWWTAVAQAHGHIQLYGWAGLFVLGVALHFLPRLRGTPLVFPRLIPWVLVCLVSGLLLRGLSQPLFTITDKGIWSLLLIVSSILECVALLGVVLMLALTAKKGPSLAARKAFAAVLPFMAIAFSSLGVASCVNLVNTIDAGRGIGLILPSGDDLNVLLGLFGFLMPVALAMSAQALPMYAGLEAFPRRVLWPLAGIYLIGLVLASIGTGTGIEQANWTGIVSGLGMLLMGIVFLVFIGIFLSMMRQRGRLPQRVAQLAPSAETAARTYQKKVASERNAYGPFVALVASAYLWAALGGILLSIDGLAMLLGSAPLFSIDAIRHSLTVGFITLLICGIAPRMIPGFSGGNIATPVLVSATLWLGNIAALLRVGSILAGPLLFGLNLAGYSLASLLFGLSGPVGLALAICLTVNLWPALWPRKQAAK